MTPDRPERRPSPVPEASDPERESDRIAEAARRSVERAELARALPEPSLASRLGQIGILGWAIVTPMLLGLVLGRLADRPFATGIFFPAPAIFIGAGIGFYAAWKWMHRP